MICAGSQRRFLRASSALLAAASLIHPAVVAEARSGDLNGDGRIDVLDMQAVLGSLLAGQEPGSGDVNGDGRVDVLDLQRVLSGTANAGRPGEESGRRGDALRATAPYPTAGARPRVCLGVAPAPARTSPGPTAAAEMKRPVFESVCDERYRFGLIPNAPPRAQRPIESI